jgi:glycosyltransferase involved in cell wall biosynthesis
VILFCTPDTARPSGGVRAIYRAVDLLNDAGLDAAVLHTKPGFRCDWFTNATRVVHPPVTVDGGDVLVVPEAFTYADVARLPAGVPKVIFNQNAYRTFRSATRRDGVVVETAADHRDVAAVMVVSEDNRALLERALPNARVVRVHHWIDETVFGPGASPRAHRIVAMPRKRPADFRLLLDLLHARGALDGWEVVTLGGRPEADVAREFGRAALFVALGREEGFGLPVAEALASGCAVAGFHGMGGRELFACDAAIAIEDGDVGALAACVEEFVTRYDDDAPQWARRGDAAVDFVRATYSKARATDDLLACFNGISRGDHAAAHELVARDLPRRNAVERARTVVERIGRRFVTQRGG